jgi:hypothetical protein
MFTFKGDTVLDPFLGSGTTVKVALELGRNGLGYEINKDFLSIIEEKIGIKDKLPIFSKNIQIIRKNNHILELPEIDYIPAIQDAKTLLEPGELKRETLFKVVQIVSEDKIKLENGQIVKFLGVKIEKEKETIEYLIDKILGKQIIIKNNTEHIYDNIISAYIYLKNKIFVNGYLIKSGLGIPDLSIKHKFKEKFITIWKERRQYG